MFYYPDFVGRNVEEIKRTLIALQTHEKSDVLLPANWKPGNDVLIHSPKTMADADKLKSKADPNLRMVTWYMWFRKM
jgi:peroxiredoxin (alkyl hydroperoxide reductase subunit C)